MKKPNLTVILNCQYCLVNNYLEKGFYVIEQESKQLSILPNNAKLGIYVIEELETDLYMVKSTAIYYVANSTKKCIYIGKYALALPTRLL